MKVSAAACGRPVLGLRATAPLRWNHGALPWSLGLRYKPTHRAHRETHYYSKKALSSQTLAPTNGALPRSWRRLRNCG